MARFMDSFKGNVRGFGMIFALLALIVFFQWQTGGNVLTPSNAMNIIINNSHVLIMTMGMLMVIVIGHIDLSVGSVAATVGIVVALATAEWELHWALAVLLGIALGFLIGSWQGFWLAQIGIPGFITTLAGMMFFRGLNQYIGHSKTIPVPEQIQKMGSGYLPEWGPNTGMNNSTLLLGIVAILALVFLEFRKRTRLARINADVPPLYASILKLVLFGVVIGYLVQLFGTGRPGTSFPIPGVILVVLAIIYTFVTTRTTIGRHVYAVGGNKAAAALSGVNTKGTYFFVMLNMSVLASLAGILFIGRMRASGPADGLNWELDVIAAVFIGGAAVSGGVGTVMGSIIGGMVMAVLNNGLQLMSIGAASQQMIKGLVLLAAVAFDVYNKTQGRPSITGWLTRKKGAPSDGASGGAITQVGPVDPSKPTEIA